MFFLLCFNVLLVPTSRNCRDFPIIAAHAIVRAHASTTVKLSVAGLEKFTT